MKLLGTGPSASRISPLLSKDTPDEGVCLHRANDYLANARKHHTTIALQAATWIANIRKNKPKLNSVEGLLQTFPLNSTLGLGLMQLAECYLRCPDIPTRTKLIAELLAQLPEQKTEDHTPALIGTILNLLSKVEQHQTNGQSNWLEELASPWIQKAVETGIETTGQQFLMAEHISQALQKSAKNKTNQSYSFDILGEGARTRHDAELYFQNYLAAAHELIQHRPSISTLHCNNSLSIKLSALSPHFDERKRLTELPLLIDKVFTLAMVCLPNEIALTLDAEENARLLFTLEVLEGVVNQLRTAKQTNLDLKIEGLGLAVQAYSRRSFVVIEHLIDWAEEHYHGLQIRLVKGAYWDAEIATAQRDGQENFPVFTSKPATDLNYLACTKKLLNARGTVYPMLATHNAYTLAAILEYAQMGPYKGLTGFECQRLFGMGDALWHAVRKDAEFAQVPCRIYAPVGPYSHALAYLIRRLLENGANSSFVNALYNAHISIETLTADPIKTCENLMFNPDPKITQPADLFPNRPNSKGIDLQNRETQIWLKSQMAHIDIQQFEQSEGPTSESSLQAMFDTCQTAQSEWTKLPLKQRSNTLIQWAHLLEKNRAELLGLLVHEAGKTWGDAIAELREGIDFLLYYSAESLPLLSTGQSLPGPAGEKNYTQWHPRGVCLCISPWNFPLAIFIGQISACLIGGNGVLAKAAPQTQRIAYYLINLGKKAGLPEGLVQNLGANTTWTQQAIIQLPINAVLFTGSTQTAKQIAINLANKTGPIVPLIAETGGVNCMIIDSTALLEQSCDAIVHSAFGSAGQRCSALRVVYVQEEISDALLEMVTGATALLDMHTSPQLETDLGPVIDTTAFNKLNDGLRHFGLPEQIQNTGDKPLFVPVIIPQAFPGDLSQEWFGPILQWVTYRSDQLKEIYSAISKSGWGLTLGLQSRLPSRMKEVSQLPVGNVYINRGITGAVVGSQPFGGQGLSGTGPKAGGIGLVLSTMTQRTVSNNSASVGGVIDLLT